MTHFYVWMALLRSQLCTIIEEDSVTDLMNECYDELFALFARGIPVNRVYGLIDYETRNM